MILRLLCCVVLSLSLGWGTALAATLTIPGTGDSQSLLRALADAYQKAHPEDLIDVPDSIGSSGGIKAVSKGKAEMARVARGIKDREKEDDLFYTQFASCPVVLAVNAAADVHGLTSEQALGIFKGTINDWKELGGKSGTIYIVQREKGDSSRTLLEEKLAGFNDIAELAGKIVYSTPEAVDLIMSHVGTIGYAPAAMLHNTGLKKLVLDNNDPNNIESLKDYGLMIPFALVWKEKGLSDLGRNFKKFVFSAEGQRVIREYGAFPVQGEAK